MKSRTVFTTVVLLVMALASVVQAKPSFGISCVDCHASTTGMMSVTGHDTTTNLGTQLDGQSRGTLKTFVVSPGSTISLSISVTAGTSKNAPEILGFEKGGQQNSNSNAMVWSENNSGTNTWSKYGTGQPYFTKNGSSDGSTHVYNFDLFVDAGTPADVYDMTFGVGGKDGGLWYQEEHFYVKVEASTPAATITVVNPNGGETLAGGQSHTIQWDSTGTINTVLIEYSTNNGSSWEQIANNIANSGSYNWAVPQISSSQSLVRVTGDAVSDVSNAVFAIAWNPGDPVITGYTRTASGDAIGGATISASNGGGSATTDAAGFYSVTVPYDWSGTITPAKTDYTFNPSTVSYSNVTADQAGENYVGALPTSSNISGKITTANNIAIAGVLVSADNGGSSATTDAAGLYSVTVPYGWSGAITPTKTDYTFDPSTVSYTNVTADLAGENYVGALPVGSSISGQIATADNTAVSGALVSADNGGTSATTDAAGSYSVTVPYGWSGAITPTKADHTFSPASTSYTNVTTDAANENYTALLITSPIISGSVKTAAGVAIDGVLVSASNGVSATTDAAGSYSITVPYNFSGTVTPTKADHTFEPANASYSNLIADAANEDYIGAGIPYSAASHVFGVGIAQIYDHGNTAVINDSSYVFYLNLETDATVTLIEILTPAGTNIQIPADAHTQAGNVQTWHGPDTLSSNYLWEYEASFADAAGLAGFGDGNYTVTLHTDTNETAETSVWFGAANGSDPLAQPTQEPAPVSPQNGLEVQSPVEFSWQQPADQLTSITLKVENAQTNQADIFVIAPAVTSHGPVNLAQGNWQGLLAFENIDSYNSADAIPVTASKSSEADWQFSVSAPAESELIIDNGDNGTSSTGTWKVSGASGAYGANSLYSKTAGDAYTFETARSTYNAVYLWHTAWPSRSTAVTVEIRDGSNLLDTVIVNQQQNQSQWNLLGKYNFTDTAKVTLVATSGSTNADAVKFVPEIPPVLSSIQIEGPVTVSKNSNVNYTLNAVYSDGSSQSVAADSWSVNSSAASVSADGVLSAGDVAAETAATISASYSEGGISKTATHDITITEGPAATEIIIDNNDAGASGTGTWKVSGGANAYGANSLWSKTAGATFSFAANTAAGTSYQVSMWWTNWPSRVRNAAVQIYSGDTLVDTVPVDQFANGGKWNVLGTYTFNGNARITIVSNGSGSTCADAVKLTPAGVTDPEPDPEPSEIIVDNSDPAAYGTSGWPVSGGANPYGSNSQWSKTVGATFNFQTNAVGTYDIYAWWTNWPSRRTSVPCEIFSGNTLIDVVIVNQQDPGGKWNLIASGVTFAQAAKITIVSLGGGSTNADAIKLVPVADNGGGDPGTDDPGTGDPGTGDPDDSDPGTGDPDDGDPDDGDPDDSDPDDGDPDDGDDTPTPGTVITITKAQYHTGDREFRVEATTTNQPDDVLTVQGHGEMTYKADKNKYEYRIKPVDDPGQSVTITSDSGESITVEIEYKY